ncbi:MAG: penicillin acylase family protein [Actinobacteria bacterium]|nr:penicillin acylase family protein [Actinomycetota bacterium]
MNRRRLGLVDKLWRAAAAAAADRGRRSLPRTDGSYIVRGITAPVEIIWDRWGIPHIYAGCFEDLMFAQGFVHAQDRLWQMDFLRRLVAGRLSEVFGPVTVSLDRWVRIVGLREAAERQELELDEGSLSYLRAYAAGVDAWVETSGSLPLEFRLLRYQPQSWTVADGLGSIKLLAWLLSSNWEVELLREQLVRRLGDVAAELEPRAAEDTCIVALPGSRAALERARKARRFLGPGVAQGVGSNSWVVAGRYTVGGAPLLANDMHLSLLLPAIWYQVHLVAPDIDAVGVSLPGLPCLVSGFNGRVAWGITAGMVDVQDLYRERIRSRMVEGKKRVEWLHRGEWLPARVRREEIRVRGLPWRVVQEVVHTGHGPVINLLAPREMGEPFMALRWTGSETDNVTRLMRRLLLVGSAEEFRETLRDWAVPAVNMVYADIKGSIGYRLAGRIPRRAPGRGRVPCVGWTGTDEWCGFIPFEELPAEDDPESGYIVTANNRVASTDYPYYLGNEYATDDRAQRIEELLLAAVGAGRPLDKETMRAIQLDQVSLTGREVAGHFARLTGSAHLQRGGRLVAGLASILAEWDGSMSADSTAAALSETFVQVSLALMLRRRLGRLLPRYSGQGPTPLLAEWSVFGERAREWLMRCLRETSSPWFGVGGENNRDRFLVRALIVTAARLSLQLGPDPRGWTWGRLHTMYFSHALGALPGVNRLLGRGPYPVGGDEHTVWAVSSRGGGHIQGRVGPPFRFVCDLACGGKAWGILAPGQSGWPGSPHFDDGVVGWFAGRLRPLVRERRDVQRHEESRMELLPTSPLREGVRDRTA